MKFRVSLSAAFYCLTLLFTFSSTSLSLFAQKATGFQQTDSGFVRFDIDFKLDPRTPLKKEKTNPGLSIAGYLGGFEYTTPSSIQHKTQLDSSGQFLTISQTLRDVPVTLPQIISLEEYNSIERENRVRDNYAGRR